MAATTSTSEMQTLQSELSCPICLDYFEDPVITQCGHNFCRACIVRSWEGRQENFPCPQCRGLSAQRNIRANQQLANVVGLSKQVSLKRKERDEVVCAKHNEDMTLFCQDHQKLICVVCKRSRDHLGHTVRPLEEAAPEYKEIFPSHLEKLDQQVKELKSYTEEERQIGNAIELKFKDQSLNISGSFERLKLIFESEKRRVIGSLQKEIEAEKQSHERNLFELEKQQSSVRDLIVELERRSQARNVELLKDMQSLMNRFDNVKVETPMDNSLEEKTIQSFVAQQDFLKETVKDLKANLESGLEGARIKVFKVRVTLDADTAHAQLLLSGDQTGVRHIEPPQCLPHHPKRFSAADCCVMGTQGFTSGRHYWEVRPLQVGGWFVGVAAESVIRDEVFRWLPARGVWTVMGSFGQYTIIKSTNYRLVLKERPQKLGLYLDYEGGRLSLYNADSMEHLYTFIQDSFRERIFPFFCLYDAAQLSLV